jgi:hypothetical protein
VSYNPGLGDSGVIELLAALPLSITELGIAGCGLSDKSGLFLLKWGHCATRLRMICAEGNKLSPQMRQQLANLKDTGAKPDVFL